MTNLCSLHGKCVHEIWHTYSLPCKEHIDNLTLLNDFIQTRLVLRLLLISSLLVEMRLVLNLLLLFS